MKGLTEKLVKGLLIVLIAATGIFVLQSKNMFVQNCSKPISYKIGTFDSRFGLSQGEFLQDVQQAAKMWSDSLNGQLFIYDQNRGSLSVNLIYDQRQQATEQLAKLGIQIKDDKSTYDTLQQRYQTMKSQYDTQKAQLDSLVRSYQMQKSTYEQQVQYWNSRGGAPKGEYGQLEAEKQQLSVMADSLTQKQSSLNDLASNVNALVDALNRLGSILNLNVTSYNKIGATTGSEFEEGIYKSSGNNQEIDIYQFDSKDKLVRVLAHEFGHALGLDHVSDPQAIMYKLNQGDNLVLTSADIGELKQKCNIK